MPGPPPKRSDQRRRRNVKPIEAVLVEDVVRGYELPGDHCELAGRFWESLRVSGQSVFFEPSDWVQGEIVVVALDAYVARPSANMLMALNSAMSGLLVTEADRRRLGLEVQRREAEEDHGVAWLEDARLRRESG